MNDAEIADRLLEMREATARKCVEIAENHWESYNQDCANHPQSCFREIASAIKKEFGLED